MKIGHVFNDLLRSDNEYKYIDSQELSISYILNKEPEVYQPTDIFDLKEDFAKKYYYSLYPIKNRSQISYYDETKLNTIVENLGKNLIMISGDFWGIQKFIFDGLISKKAPKILRSRSAMVQLITFAVVDFLKENFSDSELLLFGAGKFMILAKEEKGYVRKIKSIQKILDNYFLKNYFGQNGFIISTALTTAKKVKNQQNQEIKSDLTALGKDNDLNKLQKFDLLSLKEDDVIHDTFNNTNSDDEICEFCSKRIKTHNVDDTKSCEICFNQIELGKQLVKNDFLEIFATDKIESKENIKIISFGSKNYYARFTNKTNKTHGGTMFDIGEGDYFQYPKWSLKSYVTMQQDRTVKTFGEYIEKNGKPISSGLMALKADIDKLGKTFREFYQDDLRKFNRLSREVDFFFSDYVTYIIKQYDNVYTVFSGGDDLFVIGEYSQIIKLAKHIRDEFYKFSLHTTTLSMGLVMFKPSIPITYISTLADEAEQRAKKVTDENGLDRNGIDIFGISMKYDEFIVIEEKFKKVIKYLKEQNVETTAFYYRLIELCDMKENIDKKIRNAMWKSKLNYLFQRNIKKENNDTNIFNIVSELVERGEKFKPSIFLKIYENKDNKKEQNDEAI